MVGIFDNLDEDLTARAAASKQAVALQKAEGERRRQASVDALPLLSLAVDELTSRRIPTHNVCGIEGWFLGSGHLVSVERQLYLLHHGWLFTVGGRVWQAKQGKPVGILAIELVTEMSYSGSGEPGMQYDWETFEPMGSWLREKLLLLLSADDAT